jgi:hypothetical protein
MDSPSPTPPREPTSPPPTLPREEVEAVTTTTAVDRGGSSSSTPPRSVTRASVTRPAAPLEARSVRRPQAPSRRRLRTLLLLRTQYGRVARRWRASALPWHRLEGVRRHHRPLPSTDRTLGLLRRVWERRGCHLWRQLGEGLPRRTPSLGLQLLSIRRSLLVACLRGAAIGMALVRMGRRPRMRARWPRP